MPWRWQPQPSKSYLQLCHTGLSICWYTTEGRPIERSIERTADNYAHRLNPHLIFIVLLSCRSA